MPFWGKPLIEHALDLLATWGVREILINLHHAPCPMLEFGIAHSRPGLHISFSFEPLIVGTGGAIRKAEWFLDDQPLWILNGDIALGVEPSHFLRAYRRLSPLSAVWVTDQAGPRTVEVDGELVRTFTSRRAGQPGTYTFCGLHLVSAALLPHIPTTTPSSIIDAYTRAMAAGCRVAAVSPARAFWSDIGTPEDYVEAHGRALRCHRRGLPGGDLVDRTPLKRAKSLAESGVRVSGFASVGSHVRIAGGARLSDAVVWDHSTVYRRADVRNAIVAGAAVRGHVSRIAVPAETCDDVKVDNAIRALGWRVSDTTACPLSPRGSSRRFTRLESPRGAAIVIDYDPERTENKLYVRNARLLARLGVRVPKVLAHFPKQNLCIMEDAGAVHLQEAVTDLAGPARVRLYKQVLEEVLRLHVRGAPAARRLSMRLCPPFSPPLYRWEHELFLSHFVSGYLGLGSRALGRLRAELEQVASALAQEPDVLVHRDLQSSNILLLAGRPILIDFQGMRMGPAVYDVGSLLFDPYVCLPPRIQTELWIYYARKTGQDPEGFGRRLHWGAAQRLVQAIGAYARLAADPATATFARHLVPGLRMLRRVLGRLPGLSALRKTVLGAIKEGLHGKLSRR